MPTFQIETKQFRFDHSRTAFTPFYEALFDETAFDLSPEYWGFEEPIDESLSKDDPKKDLLDRWEDAHPLAPISVERNSPPSYWFYASLSTEYVDSNGEFHGFPPFTKGYTSTKIDIGTHSFDVVDRFLSLLLDHLQPRFASISTESDYLEKHEFTVDDGLGTLTTREGFRIKDTLPGIYYKTYISDDLVEDFRLNRCDET